MGSDPAAAVGEIAARVLRLLDSRDGTELVTTIAGGMWLRDYLPIAPSSWPCTPRTSPARSESPWTSC